MRRNSIITTIALSVAAMAAFAGSAAASQPQTAPAIDLTQMLHSIASSAPQTQFLDGIFDKLETVIIDFIAVRGGPLAIASGLIMYMFGKSGNMVSKGTKLMWGGLAISTIGVGWKMFNKLIQWFGTF